MSFHDDIASAPAVPVARQSRGRMAHAAGHSAELRVAQHYERGGHPVLRRRWRGRAGEIDLILRDGDGLIFVEVKQARCLARAAASLSHRQLRRICGAAEEFLASEPRGSLTDVRFDVALVDGTGRTEIIENALA